VATAQRFAVNQRSHNPHRKVLIRRGPGPQGKGARRITTWQVTLFFLAAGVWVAGVIVDDTRLTGVAIVLLLAAIVLRIVRDRDPAAPDDPDERAA